jgi:hypothetical protein
MHLLHLQNIGLSQHYRHQIVLESHREVTEHRFCTVQALYGGGEELQGCGQTSARLLQELQL